MKASKSLKRLQRKREKRNHESKIKQKLKRINKQNGQNVVFHLFKTITHFFPDLIERIRQIEDCRKKSDYELVELIMACIAMSLFKADSRNAFNNEREEGNFKDNYQKILKMRLPHMDTADNVMRRINPDELQQLKTDLIRTLLEKKTFHKFRLFKKFFIIAVDGTGLMTFPKRHCEHCLTKTSKKGKTKYFHHVLEAKLICPNGFAISIATEWIENPEGDFDKQDCEMKAFPRLAEKIKEMFPRLPICITADGLYPNQTFFGICKVNHWSFIVTFKDGNLPSVWQEVRLLREITTDNQDQLAIFRKQKKIKRDYTWLNEIDYQGFQLNWIECIETIQSPESEQNSVTRFVHVTDLKVEKSTSAKISQTGRLRWKIENEGFNTQKNQGYNLKHKFSRTSLIAAKNYYQCIQIAHLINQLSILSITFQQLLSSKITIKHLWKCMIGFLICGTIDRSQIKMIAKIRIQIRF
jgi:hypothetical protein